LGCRCLAMEREGVEWNREDVVRDVLETNEAHEHSDLGVPAAE